MAIAPIQTNASVTPSAKVAPVEAGEVTRGGKDARNDGDADDAVAASKAAPPRPVTNTLGQVIGRNLNVQG